MIVDARMYAVVTHSMWSTPSSSPTMVGSAVAKMVWLSDASSIAVMRPMNTGITEFRARPGAFASASRVVVIPRVLLRGLGRGARVGGDSARRVGASCT
ncbi:hypothetical protein [Demequina iriomotensis]|uniref:hypothetical protein n=1 Tax=Demequina iriomotensis TaxID=1536641 RepID=UPI00225E231E|nr:hypothetical protein [Demequina iriomotensis]